MIFRTFWDKNRVSLNSWVVKNLNPFLRSLGTVFDFSTVNASESLMGGNYFGSIEIGKKADIIIIDFNKPHLLPKHNYVSNIVYSANGNDVDTTIINGQPIMIEKEFISLDKQKILDDAEYCAKNLTS